MHPPLRIGILGTRGIPNRYGGFEECAEKLALGLVEKGHQVWVYNSHKHEYRQAQWQGVNIVHCKDPEDRFGTAGQFIYDYNCFTDARRRGFDILLQLGYTSSSIWWWRWPRKAINVINMDGLEWKRSKYSSKVQRFLKWAEKLAARHGDHLVADSPGIQQHLKAQFGKESSYIAYGAVPFDTPDKSVPAGFGLEPFGYHLLIARMEPENNIRAAIEGHRLSRDARPLIVIGSTANEYGAALKAEFEQAGTTIFPGAIYNAAVINSLRYYSNLYFHGHSVGGTNPSLLEAMACRALIAAHNNVFNRAILGHEAFYFRDAAEAAEIIRTMSARSTYNGFLEMNAAKIRETYNWPAIVNAYDRLFTQLVTDR